MGKCCPISFEGRKFPSRVALGRHLGLSRSAVGAALRRGRLEVLGTGSNTPVPIYVAGRTWPSSAAAARELGLSAARISRALDRGTIEALVKIALAARVAA